MSSCVFHGGPTGAIGTLRGVVLRQKRQEIEAAGERALALLRRHDGEDNRLFRLPTGERVRWPACYLTEIYLPSHVASLDASLRRLKWDGSARGRQWDVAGWLARTRTELSSHGADTHFGWLRQSAGGFDGGLFVTPPAGVRHLHATFHAIASSATVLVVAFVLDDAEADGLQLVLASDVESRVEPMPGGGHQLFEVRHVKERTLGERRAAMHRRCAEWLNAHLPGLFASGDELVRPRLDLLLTEQARPFAAPPAGGGPGWTALLGFDSPDAWVDPHDDGMRLALPDATRAPGVVTLAGRRADVLAGRRPGEERSENDLIYETHLSLGGLLCRLSLDEALGTYQRYLVRIGKDMRQRGRTVRRLARARDALLGLGTDVQALVADLEWLVEEPRRYESGVADLYAAEDAFTRQYPSEHATASRYERNALKRLARRLLNRFRQQPEARAAPGSISERGDPDLRLTSRLREEVRWRAELLARSERRTLEALRISSDLDATAASIRATRTALVISAVAAVVAIMALLIDARVLT